MKKRPRLLREDLSSKVRPSQSGCHEGHIARGEGSVSVISENHKSVVPFLVPARDRCPENRRRSHMTGYSGPSPVQSQVNYNDLWLKTQVNSGSQTRLQVN